MTRNEIATELMRDCPDDLEPSHQIIADAINAGKPIDDILNMCDDWPDTYVWLKNEFSDCEDA